MTMSSSSTLGMESLLKTKPTSEAERRHLMKELLQLADKNKDGVLDFGECKSAFAKRGLRLSEEEIRNIFQNTDKNGDRKISPNELWDEEQELKDKAKAAFVAYDRNKDGFVSQQEMALISSGRLTKEQIRAVFKANDKDGDGVLSQQEFEDMMRKSKKGPEGAL